MTWTRLPGAWCQAVVAMSYELSIVIPVYNEEANIGAVLARVTEVLAGIGKRYEILAVNDGSTDRTLDVLKQCQRGHAELTIIDLRRNFGHHPATYAGFDHARGDVVVTLDGDLENDPADIPKLLQRLEQGYDIVCGWRKHKRGPLLSRRWPSRVVNFLVSRATREPVRDYGCFLRAYTSRAAKEIAGRATRRSWFPVLFGTLGFRVGEVEVQHRLRENDRSRHNVFKRVEQFISVFIDTVPRPFHLIEAFAVVLVLTGAVGLLAYLGAFLITWRFLNPVLALLALNTFLGGALLLLVALIGEYVVRLEDRLDGKSKYLVREVIVAGDGRNVGEGARPTYENVGAPEGSGS